MKWKEKSRIVEGMRWEGLLRGKVFGGDHKDEDGESGRGEIGLCWAGGQRGWG